MKRSPGVVLRCVLFILAVVRCHAADETVPHDLTLRQCIQIALVHNPQLRRASELFLTAEGRSIELHAILYPTVNAQGLSTPLTFYVQIQETFYSRATLPQLRLSRLTHEQAFLNYRQTVADVVFQVRQAFTNELGAREQARLSRQLIDSRDAAVETAQQLFSAGHLRKSDVLPLQVLASLARQDESLATLGEQQGTLALSQIMGVDLPDDVQLQGEIEDNGPAQFDVAALTAQALHDRQDLQLLENARLSSTQQIEIDLKDAYPTAGFESDSALQPPSPSFIPSNTGSYDLERNYDEPETQRESGDTQLPLSLYVNWQIFDGGRLAGVKVSDRAQIASQQVAVDALRRAIPGEVAEAVATIETARATLRLLHDQPAPAAVERDADTDYQAGRVRLLDKVNLQSDIVRQRQLRLASQIRLGLALATLDHALGRDLETPRTAPVP
jgi:outer membrane protein TolC